MCVYLSIDLKSITDDRLRTHIQNADPVDFLMLYLTMSLNATVSTMDAGAAAV